MRDDGLQRALIERQARNHVPPLAHEVQGVSTEGVAGDLGDLGGVQQLWTLTLTTVLPQGGEFRHGIDRRKESRMQEGNAAPAIRLLRMYHGRMEDPDWVEPGHGEKAGADFLVRVNECHGVVLTLAPMLPKREGVLSGPVLILKEQKASHNSGGHPPRQASQARPVRGGVGGHAVPG
jgi:hypothetical protein